MAVTRAIVMDYAGNAHVVAVVGEEGGLVFVLSERDFVRLQRGDPRAVPIGHRADHVFVYDEIVASGLPEAGRVGKRWWGGLAKWTPESAK